ncbi:MAG: glycosyltransferase [Flavobacteriaceae bacterium]|nr:glycosyltransferase [Flavobacteriaceae bacterium]
MYGLNQKRRALFSSDKNNNLKSKKSNKIIVTFEKISFLNQRLHILFLSSWYPSRVLPNNGDFIQRHAEAVATKHQVTLLHVISDTKLKKEIEITENQTNDVRTLIAYIKTSDNPIVKFFRFFNAYIVLIRQVKKFNMVHLNVIFPVGLVALYLKWFKQKPFIISEHWSDYQYPLNKSIPFFIKFLTKTITKNASFICPVTNHLQNAMIGYGLKGNYCPVPNVVNTEVFNIQNKVPKQFTLTHVSNMDVEIKNITGILNVISKLQIKIPDFKINLIGASSSDLSELINQLKIKNTNVTGQIANVQVSEYLKSSSVFVLFSNYENLPCVILEAFSCGVPVVATNVGGINEYFPKEFGFLINPKDESALEKAILKIYNLEINTNKQEMHQYAEENFSIHTICNLFSGIYEKTLYPKK